MKKIAITGIRGIPAAHGGFETFAEYLAPYLVKQGWDVTVYCQEDGTGPNFRDSWEGVKLIHIPVKGQGGFASIVFDAKAAFHAMKTKNQVVLTLGYNTAFLNILYRLRKIPNLINMDGIEWKRQKWSKPIRVFFYINERLGCWLGHHLVADHPEIKKYLTSRVKAEKITMAAYGAPEISGADAELLAPYNIEPKQYAVMIGRIEPENSILDIVQAWSAKPRGKKLVVLGNFKDNNSYHNRIKKIASNEVLFPGAIYDQKIVQALRFHAALYIHGHTVGGTNPSLLESLGAGSPVLAHDNHFNRWVAGEQQVYFTNSTDCAAKLATVLHDTTQLSTMAAASKERFNEAFRWENVLPEHEALLEKWLPGNL